MASASEAPGNPGSATDDELVAMIAAEDDAAFFELWLRWSPRIIRGFRFHWRIFEEETASDLTQDTLYRIRRYAGSYRREGQGPAGWISRVAANVARDYFRANGKDPVMLGVDDPELLLGMMRDSEVVGRPIGFDAQLRRAVGSCADALTGTEREVCRLFFWEDVGKGSAAGEKLQRRKNTPDRQAEGADEPAAPGAGYKGGQAAGRRARRTLQRLLMKLWRCLKSKGVETSFPRLYADEGEAGVN
jgi:DNA-directed RNA polymerase specialized sigma24 family protein